MRNSEGILVRARDISPVGDIRAIFQPLVDQRLVAHGRGGEDSITAWGNRLIGRLLNDQRWRRCHRQQGSDTYVRAEGIADEKRVRTRIVRRDVTKRQSARAGAGDV